MMKVSPEKLTVTEAAAIAAVPLMTIRRWIQSGRLTAHRTRPTPYGPAYVIQRDALDAILKDLSRVQAVTANAATRRSASGRPVPQAGGIGGDPPLAHRALETDSGSGTALPPCNVIVYDAEARVRARQRLAEGRLRRADGDLRACTRRRRLQRADQE